MVKLLIGGSPCTFWSIAQKNGREVTAEGLGWELFKNYLIAKEKFKPDFFLYENNKSAAQPIKDQIARELGTEFSDYTLAACGASERRKPWKQQKKGPPAATGRPMREHPAARQRTDPAPKV